MKTNETVIITMCQAVDWTVSKAVDWPLYQTMVGAVYRLASDAMCRTVYGNMGGAVSRAVYLAVSDDFRHPALSDFLPGTA